MREKRVDVVEEVSVPVGDAARGENENSLFGFPEGGGAGGGGVFVAVGFGEGFVDGGHYGRAMDVSQLACFEFGLGFFGGRTLIGLTRVQAIRLPLSISELLVAGKDSLGP